MKTRLIALSMQIKSQHRKEHLLSDAQVRALLSALTCIYEEALVWMSVKNIVIMVVGDNGELLRQSIMRWESQLRKLQLKYDDAARAFLTNITNGSEWRRMSPDEKLRSLENSCALAAESTGAVLNEVTHACVEQLQGNARSPAGNAVKSRSSENPNSLDRSLKHYSLSTIGTTNSAQL